MSNNRFGCFSVVLVIVLGLSLLINLVLVAGKFTESVGDHISTGPRFDEAVVVPSKTNADQKIALISLRGVISGSQAGSVGQTMVDDLRIQCKQAGDDPKIKAVVLCIDSPGGEVTASDVIYNAVKNLRDNSKKPVVVYMGSMAASGGYYAACGGSWLIANETTFTGSIGVIMQSLNYQQLFGKVGLETLTFKSGKFKDMLSGSRTVTEDEKDYIQGMIMQTYSKFVGIVAKERNLPEDQLRAGLADGRVVSGKDALDGKLINQLGQIEDAYAKALEMANIKDATFVRYDAGFKLGKLFHMLGESEKAKIEIDLAKTLSPKMEAGRMYYLPSMYAQ